jgi:hypothetical protein
MNKNFSLINVTNQINPSHRTASFVSHIMHVLVFSGISHMSLLNILCACKCKHHLRTSLVCDGRAFLSVMNAYCAAALCVVEMEINIPSH